MAAQLKAIQGDKLLTGVSNMISARDFDLVCESVLPVISVMQRNGKLADYGHGQLVVVETRVTGDGRFRRAEPISRSSNNYQLDRHGIYDRVTPDDYANVPAPYQAEVDLTIGLSSTIKIEKENSFASLFNATNLTQGKTLSASEKFDTDTGSIANEIKLARNTIKEGCGKYPNTAIIPAQVMNSLVRNDELKGWYRSGADRPKGGIIDYSEIAKYFQVDRLFVPDAAKATSATSALSEIWGKDIFLGVMPTTAMKRQVSFGYMVRGYGRSMSVIKKPALNPPDALNIFVRDDYAYLITNVKAGYAMRAVIS